MDVERAEVIAAELDMLIRRRADKPPDPDELEPSYRESVRRHRERIRRANRALWYAYHLDQAERLRRTMTVLVEAHEEAALRLLEDEPKGER